MKALRYMLNKQPIASVVIVIVLAFVATASIFQGLAASMESQPLAENYAKLLAGLLMLLILYRNGTAAGAAAGVQSHTRRTWWWAAPLLMSLSVPLNFQVNQVILRDLVFSEDRAISWVLDSLASGVWEEALFRGICFTLLIRAWGCTRSALFKAALIPTLLFGVLHLVNLPHSSLENILFQVPRAALAGFGFAGLCLYTGSIWPAVLLHAGINAAGSFDNFFAGPAYGFQEATLVFRILELSIVILFVALPGLWCLIRASVRRNPLFVPAQVSTSIDRCAVS